jgi:hypothetical protein
VKDAREFGWNINGDITFDWKRLIANKVSKSLIYSFYLLYGVHILCHRLKCLMCAVVLTLSELAADKRDSSAEWSL